jgi:hypothetical protein
MHCHFRRVCGVLTETEAAEPLGSPTARRSTWRRLAGYVEVPAAQSICTSRPVRPHFRDSVCSRSSDDSQDPRVALGAYRRARRFQRKSCARFAPPPLRMIWVVVIRCNDKNPACRLRLRCWAALSLVAFSQLAYQDYAPATGAPPSSAPHCSRTSPPNSLSLRHIIDNVTVLLADYLAIPPPQPSIATSDS